MLIAFSQSNSMSVEGFVAPDISLIFVDSVGYFRTLVQLLED